MPHLNPEFRKFHDAIKLDWDDELAELRDKRDQVLDDLFARLSEDVPKNPARFNQGSYAMHTGVVPLDGDYDIDVALEFELNPRDYPRPVEVKRWVYEALSGYEVEMREPCVTVWWKDSKGKPQTHVDLAIYATHEGETFLARGKLGASIGLQTWEPADPRGLIAHVKSQPEDAEHRDQMHRVVRYLKRWKDHRFSATGEEAPRGIALTACALQWFTARDKELDAVLDLVTEVHRQGPDLCVRLPVKPHSDLFGKMNRQQRNNFYARLGELKQALVEAKAEANAEKAAERLRQQFGDDFPLPSRGRASTAATAAIGTSGASA
jgi:hypothetical protein